MRKRMITLTEMMTDKIFHQYALKKKGPTGPFAYFISFQAISCEKILARLFIVNHPKTIVAD